MKKSKASDVTSNQVLAALRDGPFRAPAHAMLTEVRNGTGFAARVQRYADALVVSCFPSRGIWFAGVEVKVSRSDWKRELDNPAKAAEIMKWCDYWWIAAAPGVVELGEVPETWGLIVAPREKGQQLVVKQAPKLSPEPLTLTFVASVLRNASQCQDAARRAGHDAAWSEAHQAVSEDAINELRGSLAVEQNAKRDIEHKLTWLERSHADLKGQVGSFERTAGIDEGAIAREHGYMGRHPVAEQLKVAQALAMHRPENLAEIFRGLAENFEALVQATKGAA